MLSSLKPLNIPARHLDDESRSIMVLLALQRLPISKPYKDASPASDDVFSRKHVRVGFPHSSFDILRDSVKHRVAAELSSDQHKN
jgi:hypothetical protein